MSSSLCARSAVLLIVLASFGAAHGGPLYGIISSGSAGDAVSGQTWNTGGSLSVAAYSSPMLSYSDSYQIGNGTLSDGASAWFTADGSGGLHGYASAQADLSQAYGGTAGGAGASFTGIWTDTLYVVGLPAGTPVEIELTNSLNSFASYSGGAGAIGGITEAASISGTRSTGVSSMFTNYDGQTYTPSNGLQTQTLVLQTFAGDTLQLEVQLGGNALSGEVGEGLLSASALADVSDTANAFITVLTPGASYTSASGIVYSDVPEPGSVWLGAVALLGIGVLARVRRAIL